MPVVFGTTSTSVDLPMRVAQSVGPVNFIKIKPNA
jgi:hypothetical protein